MGFPCFYNYSGSLPLSSSTPPIPHLLFFVLFFLLSSSPIRSAENSIKVTFIPHVTPVLILVVFGLLPHLIPLLALLIHNICFLLFCTAARAAAKKQG